MVDARTVRSHLESLVGDAVRALVDTYMGHARFEEQQFLPLAHTILGRNSNHMAALGLSLHMRHAMPDVLSRIGHRI